MQPEHGLEPGRRPVFPFRADRSWLPAGALLVAQLSFSAFGDRTLVASILLGLAAVGILFVCLIVHALGHAIAARATRSAATGSLYVFGDVPREVRRTVVAAAGPLASALAGGGLVLSAPVLGAAGDVVRVAGWASLGVAALNLLPGFPLDGGHVFASLIGKRQIPIAVGRLLGLASAAAGVWLMVSAPAVLEETAFGLWLLLAGIFIVSEGRTANRIVRTWVLDGETAGMWAKPFVGRVAATDAAPRAGGPYAVSDGSRLAGVLAAGSPAFAQKTCADVMIPWSPQLGVRTDTALRPVLERIAQGRPEVIVVVDEKGVVRGVLDERVVRERVARSS